MTGSCDRPPDAAGRGWEQAAGRRAPWAVVLAAAAAGLVAAWFAGGDRVGEEIPIEPPSAAEAPTRAPDAPSDRDTAEPAAGTPTDEGPWRLLPHAPLVRRTGHSATWTGRELVVWGGSRPHPNPLWDRRTHLASGAAYEPGAGRWRRLVPAPIAPRDRHVAAWSGSEVLVWGGRAVAREPAGAAYDPAGPGWRVLPAGPLDHAAAGGEGAWTGRELLVWAATGDGLEVAAYDPVGDGWRDGETLPLPDGVQTHATWAGSRLAVLVLGRGGVGALYRYDPGADGWDRIRGHAFPEPEGFAAVGDAVVLWGSTSAEQFGMQWGALVDVATGTLERVPGPSVRLARDHLAVETGGRLVVWDGRRGAVLDVERARWSTLPDAPIDVRSDPTGAWTGRALVVWGGGGSRYHADGAALRLPSPRVARGGPVPQ